MNEPLVSIIIRSYNEGWALRETLAALPGQSHKNWELIVIDSGSTDGSVELIEAANPAHFIQIEPSDYNPSRVMNCGMSLSLSDYCIFLNADAVPINNEWLRPLVRALTEPQTAAVFGRQIPRPDCKAVYACDYDRCFGPNRESARWPHFFSMVSSGLRKKFWERRGFLETLQYAEDHEYTLWSKKQGWRVVYCPESVVMHSHNYTLSQAYKRSFGDARAMAAWYEGDPRHFNLLNSLLLGWVADLHRDFKFCRAHGRIREWPYAGLIRWNQRRGLLAGFRRGWHDYREPHESDSFQQRFNQGAGGAS